MQIVKAKTGDWNKIVKMEKPVIEINQEEGRSRLQGGLWRSDDCFSNWREEEEEEKEEEEEENEKEEEDEFEALLLKEKEEEEDDEEEEAGEVEDEFEALLLALLSARLFSSKRFNQWECKFLISLHLTLQENQVTWCQAASM